MTRGRAVVLPIIQARLGSTRLPGKSLKSLAGQPLLWHVLDRVCASTTVRYQRVAPVVAIPWSDSALRDEVHAHLASPQSPRASVTMGATYDVLDRMYQAMRQWESRTGRPVGAIVRLTGDCPLLDPFLLDDAVERWRTRPEADLVEAIPLRYPDGLDVQVLSASALETAWRGATARYHREHVVPYLTNEAATGAVGRVDLGGDAEYPDPLRLAWANHPVKWSVDTPDDFARVRTLLRWLERRYPDAPRRYHRKFTWEAQLACFPNSASSPVPAPNSTSPSTATALSTTSPSRPRTRTRGPTPAASPSTSASRSVGSRKTSRSA